MSPLRTDRARSAPPAPPLTSTDTTTTTTTGTAPADLAGGVVTAWIRRHPLAGFFGWFFTVGQAFAFTPVVLHARDVDVPHQPFVIGSTLVGLLLPAVVITRIVAGPDAVRTLWRNALRFRASWGWYALAVLGIPAATTAAMVAFSGVPADLSAATVATALVAGLGLQLLLTLVPNNWAEEVAWTGFAQARLEQRFRPVAAALITAPLFAVQHVSLVVGTPAVLGATLIVALAVLAVPFRFLLGWAYHRTGSLVVVGLVHGTSNAVAGGSGFGLGMLPRLYPGSILAGLVHLLAIALIGTTVMIVTRGRRQDPPPGSTS